MEDQRVLRGVGDPPEVNGDGEGVPLVGADLQAAVRVAEGKALLVVRLDDAADVGDRRPAELAEAEQRVNRHPPVGGHRKARLLRTMAEVVRKRFGHSNVPSVHRGDCGTVRDAFLNDAVCIQIQALSFSLFCNERAVGFENYDVFKQ